MTISAVARHRVVVLLTLVVVALTLLLAGAVVAGASSDAESAESISVELGSHTVRTGDTLWEIAAEVAGPDDDLRDLVADIKHLNDLSSSVIVPGQVLLVPAG